MKDITKLDVTLKDYKINSISRGKEAIGRVNIQISYANNTYSGRAMDTDIIKASAMAFLNALNAVMLEETTKNDEQ